MGSSRVFQACLGCGSLDASVSGSQLTVTGFILDSISYLTSPLPPRTVERRHSAHYPHKIWLNWLLDVARWAARIQKHSNQSIDMQAIWTTAFAGCHVDSFAKISRSREHPEFDEVIEVFSESITEVLNHLGDDREIDDLESPLEPLLLKLIPVGTLIATVASGKRLAYTGGGMIALVDGEAQDGDVLSIFHDTPLPFVLRSVQGEVRLVGVCYIHGMMDQEAYESKNWKAQRIVIS
jgi:hypothetical protein